MSVALGRVTTVNMADKRIYVDVKTSPSHEHRNIEFTTPATGIWYVPTEGDIVEVYTVSTETYCARFPHTPTLPEMPSLGEGDVCFQLNDDTQLWFAKQEDGTMNISLKADGDITVSTANSGNVVVESDGDVTVNGESITLGNEGGAESLAVQSHTHPVEWTDEAGSGDTGTPNEDGTQKTKAE